MDGWTVLDAAIKIGLGGIIAGAVTIIALRMNQTDERKKIREQRAFDSLLHCADQADEVYAVMKRFIGMVVGTVVVKAKRGEVDFSKEQWKELHELDVNALEAVHSLGTTIARLNLLGFIDAATNCIQMRYEFAQFRDTMFNENRMPTVEEVREFEASMSKAVKAVRVSMREAHRHLIAD